MARTVKEWVGTTDSTKIPPRVRLRIFEREKGICHLCKQPIQVGQKWEANHEPALINGGENREFMIFPAHAKCHKEHTAQAVAEKAKVAAKRQKHIGIVDAPKMQGRPMSTTPKAFARKQKAKDKLPIPPRKVPLYQKEATGHDR